MYQVPQFSDAEMTALSHSTYELAAIGRNLNQIARRINQNPYETNQMTPQVIAELQQAVQQHVEKTRAMMNANWMRFGGDDN
ncbi:plasmid mobilization relaxosome protein MobC, partial [Acinetobacter baumannii]